MTSVELLEPAAPTLSANDLDAIKRAQPLLYQENGPYLALEALKDHLHPVRLIPDGRPEDRSWTEEPC